MSTHQSELVEGNTQAPDIDREHKIENVLRCMAEVCSRAATGDLEARIIGINDDGILGEVQHAINHILDMTDAFVRESRAALQHASEEKFYRRVMLKGFHGSYVHAATAINAATNSMKTEFDTRAKRNTEANKFEKTVQDVVESLVASASEMESSASDLAENAESTGSRMVLLQNHSSELESDVQKVAGSTESFADANESIQDKVAQSARAADVAGENIEEAANIIGELESSSKEINDVVKLVEMIARQTNLLALNASIEAARAGDAGRGFSVVANEVKNLADRTGEATTEISGMIATVVSGTSRAVKAVTSVSNTIDEMCECSEKVSADVTEQGNVTANIVSVLQESAKKTTDVRNGVELETKVAEKSRAAAAMILESASDLTEVANQLQVALKSFMEKLRS